MHRHRILIIVLSVLACISGCTEARQPPQPTVIYIPAPPPVTPKVRVAERPAPPTPVAEAPPALTATEETPATDTTRTCAWFVDDDPMAYPNELLAQLAAKRLGHSLNDVKTACVPCPFEDCP